MKKTQRALRAAPVTLDQRRQIFCVMNGHSRLTEYCFGYHSCARCGEQLGDSLGGAYQNDSAVYVVHMNAFMHDKKRFRGMNGCRCPENAKKLTAKDFKLVPQWNGWGYEQRPPWRAKSEAPQAPSRSIRGKKGPRSTR